MFDYEKLWKVLKSKGLKKVDLKTNVGITPTTLAKLNKNQNVSMEVLNRLCEYLECDIGDIVEHVYTPYKTDESLGTFSPNKTEAVHNWFSYLEGYSKSLVENELSKLDKVTSILDPFGGSGTTPLVGVFNNLDSYYCETNPVMAFITKVKTKVAFNVSGDPEKMMLFKNYMDKLKRHLNKTNADSNDNKEYDMGGFEKYFESNNIPYIQSYKEFIEKIPDEDIRDIFCVALAGVAVSISKMVRRGDLRFAKGKEVNKTNNDFKKEITIKLERIYDDLNRLPKNVGDSIFLNEDARNISEQNLVDAVITSPPYLNGTNYIRNTKLELKLLDFIKSEKDLASMHKRGIVAGINNVSNGAREYVPIDSLKYILEELNKVSYDSRIQKMIIAYFNDMEEVFIALSKVIKNEGFLIMDIGDSQFAGIHVPTHDFLIKIAEKHGFILYENEIIRSRKSKNGFDLTQRILRFKLNKRILDIDEYKRNATEFLNQMEYRNKGRNWGHGWHSMCSYRGKLKPAIANELVCRFTKPGEVVLDPMSGVGTIPFEARLQGRIGIGNDLSRLAYIVTKAKLETKNFNEVDSVLHELDNYINLNKESFKNNAEVRDFGLNKKIVDYYHEDTLTELLAARDYFLNKKLDSTDCLIMSCLMHVLHGNRPYALSRTSHPLTPYAPKGEFVYKNVVEHLRDKVERSIKQIQDGELGKDGYAYNFDINQLPNHLMEKADVIITSPPFASSFRFYTQNWLRLWFSGWTKEDFKRADSDFYDNKQNKDMDIYYEYFKACSRMLKDKGKMIIHVGKSDKINMSDELIKRSYEWFDVVESGEELIIGETHGISDIGSTTAHQFLFLIKK